MYCVDLDRSLCLIPCVDSGRSEGVIILCRFKEFTWLWWLRVPDQRHSGIIYSQSPAKSRYGNIMDCTWRIHVPAGKVIRLTSNWFNVEPNGT